VREVVTGAAPCINGLPLPLKRRSEKELETLLNVREGTHQNLLAWLRHPAGAPSARNLLDHVARLQALRQVGYCRIGRLFTKSLLSLRAKARNYGLPF